MKQKITLIFLLICLVAMAQAPGNPIDALRKKLAQESGSARTGIGRELVATLTAKADGDHERREFKAALASYLEALAILEQNAGDRPSPHLLNRIGLDELILGDYEKALYFLLRSLEAAENSSARTYITTSSYLIGYVHRDLNNSDLALEYFRMAHTSALAEGNQRYVIMSLNEIGNVHIIRKQFAVALPYKEMSLKLAREHGDPEVLANSLHDMGEMHLSQGQAARALLLLQEALVIDRKLGNVRGMVISLLNIADCQRKLGLYKDGLSCLDEARTLAKKSGQDKDLSDILLLYSYIHEAKQEYRPALAYQREYQELRQRLFNEEKAKQTVEMQTRYEVEKKQRENELLKREKQISALALAKQHNQRNFLFFLALLVMLLAAVLYNRFRIKARSNRELQAANNQISSQQAKLEEAYRSMESLARSDQLTGLPNRRVAMEEMEREEKRFQRGQKPFALVMTDIDGFKKVNDTVGHDAGDYVLQSVAALFSQSLRVQDMVCRWGGDEFLFLLPETRMDGARVFMAAVKEKIRGNNFIFNGQQLQIAASMGASVLVGGLTIEECLRRADQEMYRSRQPR